MLEHTLQGFVEELEAIEKEAGIGRMFRTLWASPKASFRGFGKGLANVRRAITGNVVTRGGKTVQMAGGKRFGHAMAGLKQMAPGAAVGTAGGLGLYGAGKAAFGD